MSWTSFWKNFLSLMAGLFAALFLLEVFLRIFNPIPYHVKGDKIVLPVNQQETIINKDYPFYSPVIRRSINAIGFRGENPSANFADDLTIMTVGGSTTRDALLSDDETWTYLLGENLKQEFNNVWINNAGLDGTSTIGHIVLMEDYVVKMHPKVVLFLIGANDVALDVSDRFDNRLFQSNSSSLKTILKKSEAVSLVINLKRAFKAKKARLLQNIGDLSSGNVKHSILSEAEQEKIIAEAASAEKLTAYAERIRKLIDISRQNGIEPIIVTQPTVAGDLLDPTTGLNLGTMEAGTVESMNGSVYAKVLQKFNDTAKSAAAKQNVFVIDLGGKMPKSTEFFADTLHYTKAGSRKVSELVFEDLSPHLMENYQSFKK